MVKKKTIQECFEMGFSIHQTRTLTGISLRTVERKYMEWVLYNLSLNTAVVEIIPGESLEEVKQLESELFAEIEKVQKASGPIPNKLKYLQFTYSHICAQH